MPHTITTILVVGVALLAIGLLVGVYVSSRDGPNDDTDGDKLITKRRLRFGIAIIVSGVWVISIAAEIIIPAYTVSILVHGIMGAVVGYLFSEEGVTFNIGG